MENLKSNKVNKRIIQLVFLFLVWGSNYSFASQYKQSEKLKSASDTTLVLEDIEHTNGVYLFTGNDEQALTYSFLNKSDKTIEANYTIAVFTHAHKEISRKSGDFSINANGRVEKILVDKTANLPYGSYYAVLEVTEKGLDKKPITKKTFFGLASNGVLRKAKENEFLYGMDVMYGNFPKKPYLFKWLDFLGVDIIRIGVFNTKMEDFDKYYEVYKNNNLKVSLLFDPPKDADSLARMKNLEKRKTFLEELARKYPEIKYYEIGNEPDLKGFYPLDMESYAYSLKELYKAIKKGNQNTVVMNGGLAMVAAEGPGRTLQFLQALDTNYIDAIAYHAHGFGSDSERWGYTNINEALKKVKKTAKMFIDTESGAPTRTEEQEKMQAATVLQKQVYAQSKDVKFLMWFRMLFFNEPYGHLYSEREPRPVMMAYRNMVENLRGYKFEKTIGLDKSGAESYLFSEIDGNKKILIAWVNDPLKYNVKFKIANQSNDIINPREIDLYGNSKPYTQIKDGLASLSINENPVYITWETKQPAFDVIKAIPVVDIAPEFVYGINANNKTDFIVKNPLNKAINASVKIKSDAGLPIVFTPKTLNLQLKPNETRKVSINAYPVSNDKKVVFTDNWLVYTSVDVFDLNNVLTIPQTITVGDQNIVGYKTTLQNNVIDFQVISGVLKNKKMALVFTEIYAVKDTSITIGTAANWYMDWYLNGNPIFNTLEKGNRGPLSIASYPIKLNLKKGNNILAAKILSGAGGWKLAVGKSAELQSIQNKTKDNFEVDILIDNKLVETQKSLVQFKKPLLKNATVSANTAPIANYQNIQPDAIIKETGVFNFFDKFPDNSKWWKGENDMSGKLWLRQDEKNLHITVEVIDDKFTEAKNEKDILNNDALIFAFKSKDTQALNEYVVSTIDKKAFIGRYEGHYLKQVIAKETLISAKITHNNNSTWYQITVPKSAIKGNENSLNILINDGDWGQRKQYIEWYPGLGNELNFASWSRIVY